MKKIFTIFLLLGTFGLKAQNNIPRETWPFLYEEFMSGATRTKDGALVTESRFNITAHDGSLLYIGKDEKIMKADMSRVYTAKLGDDVFLNVSGKMYKLLSETEYGAVLKGVEIDFEEQSKVSIGYGINSSTASAQGLAILMDGRFDTLGKNLQQTENEKNTGDILPLRENYFLFFEGRLIPAKKQEILDMPGIDKKATKAFFKQEKIRWKDTASLEKVLVFLSEHK